MAGCRRIVSVWRAALMATVIGSAWLWVDRAAAAPVAPKGPAKEAAAGPADKLAIEQQRVAQRYKHLEDVLLRMAELGAANDPRRAALLKKAVAQSKDQLIAIRLDRLVELLGKDQLSRALENQTDVNQDLRALLELLLSENRAKHIANERARIREYLRLLNGLITQQKDIQGRTTGGDDVKQLADQQKKVGEKTGDLARDICKNEDQKAEGGGKKVEAGEPKAGNQPKNGKPGDQGGAPPQIPAEPGAPDRLETARQHMQQAEAKLAKAQRQGVERQQEEAIRELQMAKAELEKILRQLREEEIGRMLAMLEARFRQNAAMARGGVRGNGASRQSALGRADPQSRDRVESPKRQGITDSRRA